MEMEIKDCCYYKENHAIDRINAIPDVGGSAAARTLELFSPGTDLAEEDNLLAQVMQTPGARCSFFIYS